jgi:hypothetical protein
MSTAMTAERASGGCQRWCQRDGDDEVPELMGCTKESVGPGAPQRRLWEELKVKEYPGARRTSKEFQ